MPEFNAGAMENVGAVTFHDSFLFRDPPTEPERLTRAEVVLHELAHMWFGDLVTMRWWDDLWLNESFATYMSFLALDEATRFTCRLAAASTACSSRSRTARTSCVTTHPIAAEVADTDEAELGFDGITYEKGASVLKQLVATIGREAFRGRHPGLLPAPRLGQRHARRLPGRARRRLRAGPWTTGREVWLGPRP